MKKITSKIWQQVEKRKYLVMLRSNVQDELRYLDAKIKQIEESLE